MKNGALLMLTAFVIIASGCVPHGTGLPFAQLEGPESGKVVVYMYMSDINSVALGMFADDTLITKLVSHSYYRYVMNPGEVTFSCCNRKLPWLRVVVKSKPGATYFLKLKMVIVPTPLGPGSRPNLIPVDEETALRELPGLRFALPSDWQ